MKLLKIEIDNLKLHIADNDIENVDKTISRIDDFIFEEEKFSSSLFGELLIILNKDEFFKMEKSWYVLKLFEENLDLLNNKQREQLLEYFKNSYFKFTDNTSCFLQLEIISELFNNEKSLDVLISLVSIRDQEKRSLVPHGFQHFIKRNNHNILIKRAFKEMLKLKNDPEPLVRDEAEKELSLVKDKVSNLDIRKT